MTPSVSTSSISSLLSDPYVELTSLINKNGNIQIKHGSKTYTIKFIKQQIGTGEEKNINLSYFTDTATLSSSEQEERGGELAELIKGAKKAMEAMDKLSSAPKEAHSFTLNFTQKYTQPSFTSTVLGGYLGINRWKFKPEPIVLETILYKESATSAEKTFTLNLQDRAQIQEELSDLNIVISNIARKTLETRPLHQPKPAAKPLINSDSEDSETPSLVTDTEDELEIPLKKNGILSKKTKEEIESSSASNSESETIVDDSNI